MYILWPNGSGPQANGDDRLWLPVSLLFSHALYQYHSSLHPDNTTLGTSLSLLSEEESLHLGDTPHWLLLRSQFSLVCLVINALVAAPACSKVTRTKVEIDQRGFLQWVEEDSLPFVGCNVMDDILPDNIFLGLGESYVFRVQLVINPLLSGTTHTHTQSTVFLHALHIHVYTYTAAIDPEQLRMVFMVTQAEAVQVVTEETFHTSNNTMEYKVQSVCFVYTCRHFI